MQRWCTNLAKRDTGRAGRLEVLVQQLVHGTTSVLAERVPQRDVAARVGMLSLLDVEQVCAEHLLVQRHDVCRAANRRADHHRRDVVDAGVRGWGDVAHQPHQRAAVALAPAYDASVGLDAHKQRVLPDARTARSSLLIVRATSSDRHGVSLHPYMYGTDS